MTFDATISSQYQSHICSSLTAISHCPNIRWQRKMKQHEIVENGSKTSETRSKPWSEENVGLHEKDPLDV
jgi:hypothetical protein